MSEPGRRREGPDGKGRPNAGEGLADAAVVRAMYRALEEGDARALARWADPAIEWIHPLVTRLPFDGTRRGLPAVLQNAFGCDAGETGPPIWAGTFLEFGDGVLVVGNFPGRRRAEGEQDALPFLHECFVRGGRVVRIREYGV